MEDLGVIKEENKTKKWIRSKVGLSLFVGEQKKKGEEKRKKRRRRGRRRREEKRYGNYDFGMDFCTLVWKYGFL